MINEIIQCIFQNYGDIDVLFELFSAFGIIDQNYENCFEISNKAGFFGINPSEVMFSDECFSLFLKYYDIIAEIDLKSINYLELLKVFDLDLPNSKGNTIYLLNKIVIESDEIKKDLISHGMLEIAFDICEAKSSHAKIAFRLLSALLSVCNSENLLRCLKTDFPNKIIELAIDSDDANFVIDMISLLVQLIVCETKSGGTSLKDICREYELVDQIKSNFDEPSENLETAVVTIERLLEDKEDQ